MKQDFVQGWILRYSMTTGRRRGSRPSVSGMKAKYVARIATSLRRSSSAQVVAPKYEPITREVIMTDYQEVELVEDPPEGSYHAAIISVPEVEEFGEEG